MTPDLFFDAFWSAYPRRAEKEAARKAWPKAVAAAGGNPQLIIDGAQRYRDDKNREATFTKYPATWLNRGCWDDDPLPPRPQANGRPAPPPAPPLAYHRPLPGTCVGEGELMAGGDLRADRELTPGG